MIHAIEVTLLARLLQTGLARSAARNLFLIKRYETARWIDPSGRKNEWQLRSDTAQSIEARLNELLPSWKEDFDFLRSISRNPLDPNDIKALASLRRPVIHGGMINRRNWNATTGLGPKHRSKLPATATLTKDWILRFRPNNGFQGVISGNPINFSEMATILTECIIPERAWLRIEGFSGVCPTHIITCENLGAYVDFPASDRMMVVYSPGTDIEAAVKLLKALPNVPWIHFGDIDYEGIGIAESIANETSRELRLFIPSFVTDYVNGAPSTKTQWKNVPNTPIFDELKKKRKRIFQEVFMLDERLAEEVANIDFHLIVLNNI